MPAHRAEPAAAAFPLLQGALVAHTHVAAGVQDAVDAYKATKEKKSFIIGKAGKLFGRESKYMYFFLSRANRYRFVSSHLN